MKPVSRRKFFSLLGWSGAALATQALPIPVVGEIAPVEASTIVTAANFTASTVSEVVTYSPELLDFIAGMQTLNQKFKEAGEAFAALEDYKGISSSVLLESMQ